MPLIARAYVCFAGGLFAGFGEYAWLAALAAIACAGLSLIRRDLGLAALAVMMFGGALVAVTSPQRMEIGGRTRFAPKTSADRSALENARERASTAIGEVFGDDAPMARALLIADQHQIPPEMRDRYARAGMVHMLSISGLHVAVVAGAVVLLLQVTRVPAGVASIVAVLITGVYVAVIGAPAPALRSAVMLAVVAASRASQRPTSPWASLALGAFVPLVQPRTVLDLGYQLSVVGIAGLIASAALTTRLLAPRLSGLRLRISRELTASVIATLLTAPLIAWYFGRISLVAPIANLVAGPILTVLQPTLFLALLLAPFPPVAGFLASAAHPLLMAFDGIAIAGASVPAGSLAVIPSLTGAVAGACVVVALLVACVARYPMRPVVVAACGVAVAAWAPLIRPPISGEMEMHVLDVGQGDAILLRTDRGRWIVVDAGRAWSTGDAGRSTLIPYIMRRGGEVAAFVLSHAHADHVGGAGSVIRALRPRTFWDAAFPQGSGIYDEALRAARESGVGWQRVDPGDSLTVDGVTMRFLAPDSSWTAALTDPNDASTIALVEFGTARFLLMGDAEVAEEEWLLRQGESELAADVLKVGHHGSSTSSSDAFLAAVEPSLAVISVGAGNTYGHPSADVLAALGRVDAQVMRTDLSGTIVIRTNGLRITAEAKGERWDISRE